jgi:hypothetical protein
MQVYIGTLSVYVNRKSGEKSSHVKFTWSLRKLRVNIHERERENREIILSEKTIEKSCYFFK